MKDIVSKYRLLASGQRLAAESEVNATNKRQHLELAAIFDGRANLLREDVDTDLT
jgi:hypothetical protein